MRQFVIALSAIAAIVSTIAPANAQYYRPGYGDGYYQQPPPYYQERYRPRYQIQCPQGLVPDNTPDGRQFCRRWYPTRGSECPPGYTLQGGQCRPYTGR